MFVAFGRVLLAAVIVSLAASGYGWIQWQNGFCHVSGYGPQCASTFSMLALALLMSKWSGAAFGAWVVALLLYGASRELRRR